MYKSSLQIVIDSKSGERSLKRLDGDLQRTERQGVQSFNKLRTLALGFAGVLGTIGAARALKGVIHEQEQLQRNMLRTTQLIKTTGREADTSAQQLMEQARGIARATLLSTEGVMKAQQTLLTFRNITGDTFDQAIEGAVDLASSMGTDLNSAVLQLGKALEDPITGMTALTRSGTVFTQAQKDMVREMVETNRTAEAQEFILGELAAQYGGTARAEAKGLAGAQDTLGQAFQESGIAIADYLNLGDRASDFYLSLADGIDSLTESLEAGDLDGHIENITTAAEVLAVLAAGRLSAALLTSAGSFGAAQIQAIRYQAAVISLTGASRTAAASQIALGAATRGAAGAMALLGGPVGAAVIAAGSIYYFREELGLTSAEALTAAGAVDEVTQAMQGLNLEAQRGFVEDLQRQFTAAESEADRLRAQLERIDRPGNQGGVSGHIISQIKHDLEEAEIEAGNLEKQLAAGVEQLEGFEEARKKRSVASTVPTMQEVTSQASGSAKSPRDRSSDVRGDSILEGLDADARGDSIIAAQQQEFEAVKRGLDEKYAIEQEHAQRMQALRDGKRQGVIQSQEEFNALALESERQKNEQLIEINGSYWERYLAAAQENLQSFDVLAGNMLENFSARFGDAFEEMVFDAKSLNDAIDGLAEGMARSVVNAVGEMAAQWLAFQAIQLAVGKTTTAAAIGEATAAGAAISAAYGPAAIAASLATSGANSVGAIAGITATTSAMQATNLIGMAHDGIDRVPKSGTWNLEEGERVVTAETSAKLDKKLDNMSGSGGGSIEVTNVFNIANGASAARAEMAKWLPMIEERTKAGVLRGINNGGPLAKATGRRT